MKNLIKSFASILLICFLVQCSTVPLTGRKQVTLLPNSTVMEMSLSSYSAFLKDNPPMAANSQQARQVGTVGSKVSVAVEKYMKEHGFADRVAGYKWEFNAVNSKEVNAWCMPGGKVVVYSAILPVTKDETGLAVVLGHEIAHAVAEHGNERMTEQLAVQLGGMGLEIALQKKPAETQQIFMAAYGVGTTLGSLAYSREHELEADRLGLIFMAMAGYNPERAVTFWQDMAKIGGAKPPTLLSTHPSDEKRIKQIQKYLPEAKAYYHPQ
jgi:predicted Zn-dependent protease